MTVAIDIPVEKSAQLALGMHGRPRRACGGLTLIKVLSRCGIERSIFEVWPHISLLGIRGQRCARTYLIGKYAADSGLSAAVIQCHAARAWDGLMTCANTGLHVIINHRATNNRLTDATREGHYTILHTISTEAIELDDPTAGHIQRLSKSEFLDLWQPNYETAGFVMIAITAETRVGEKAAIASCPRCEAPIRFRPGALFYPLNWRQGGCFQRFFCLGCDAAFQ